MMRLFDFSRWCRWTAYAAGSRHARLMDVPHPTIQSITAYAVVASTDATANAGEPAAPATFNTTPYEALQLQHGEFAITKVLTGWIQRRPALAIEVYAWAVQTRHVWPEWREWRRRAKATSYRRSAAWSPFFLMPIRALLAACELPLTRAAFETFRLSNVETQIAAAGSAVGLVVLSHVVGHRVREKRWGSLATVCVGVATASLLSLAVLRSDFLEHAAGERAKKLEAALVKAGAPPSIAPSAPAKDPLQNTAILLTLMALFFVTGVVVAHESHEPNGEIREIARSKPKSERRFDHAFKRMLRAAAAHDRVRDDAALRVTAERERTLLSVREWRFANGLWRLPSTDLPATFAESLDERLFKARDLGPSLLPTVRELERLFGEGEQAEVDNILSRLFADIHHEVPHEA